jgi:hypothetical protein
MRDIFRNGDSSVLGLVVVCLLVTLAPRLVAQMAGMGTLAGRVIDSSGGVVANATITATNLDSGQARRATAGTDGSYRF